MSLQLIKKGRLLRDPKRILQKLLGSEVEPFAETGEPLEQTVETLRDVVKCRKIREYVLEHFGFDLAITPTVFHQLLDIPQINFIETTKRDLEVETVSLKEIRGPDDPVAISNLNSVLRELYASLFQIKQRISNDYPKAVLIKEIQSEHIDRVQDLAKSISVLHGNLTGYLFTSWKAGKIEKEFLSLFPNSTKAHPLRSTFPLIEHELDLYREVLTIQKKWAPLGIDLFAILHKEDALNLLLENIQELGNRLWQVIYQSSEIRQCMEIAGIQFGDTLPLFDNDRVPLNPLG
ncbi:MAG: hypothetical protein HOF21_12515 [Nitrospina sp.]|jgi:hypothetical protein|nr:hypothetical protein [Nitrospina sp.]MBT5631321.1 hypothetical protein [Nitrospina sp.]